MKKIISIAVCFVILLSCVLPVQASGGVPEKVMESTKSVVRILSKYYSGSATGSGFVIKNEPGEVLIATNDHVVSGNPYSISVWVGENELVDAEIVFTTSAKDLCVLRVTDSIDMKPLTLSTEDPQHGAAIYVVGYPGAGDILSDTQAHTSDSVTITDGIISAIRTFTIENGAAPVKLLQVNAAINSGNSGGPLFNSEGVVIGVNTYKVNANSQGVFGSVDISELWGLLAQHGIEIPMQEEVAEEEIPEEKVIPVSVIAIAVGTVVTLIVVFLLIKAKKKKAKTLRKYMEAHPNGLGVSEAVSMLLPVAIQLRDLHNNGKLHLQVSPDSILVSATGVILKESSKKETDRLFSGFAAPEIYKGVGFGAASDIYSYAAVLYFAATGKTPSNSLQGELLDAELAFLEEGETVFAGIIRKSMAFLSQDRIQSMQELIYSISAFSTLISNQEPQINKKEPVKPPKENKRRKSGKKLVPIASVLLCVIAVAMLWKPYVQPEIDARNEEALLEEQYIAATALMEEGRFEEAMEAFAALTGYRDSDEQSENCRIAMENAVLEEKYQKAEALAAEGKHAHAGIAFAKLEDYKDARDRSFDEWSHTRKRKTIAIGSDYVSKPYIIGLKNDGTVLLCDKNSSAQRYVADWEDIVEVAMFWTIPIGLKSDGTVVMGLPISNKFIGNDYAEEWRHEVQQWTNVVAIITNVSHGIYGLRNDGTLVSTANNIFEQEVLDGWTDIVDLCVAQYKVGLKADGTVVATGEGYEGSIGPTKVEDWKDIISIDVTSFNGGHTMGICADGTVQMAGAILSDGWKMEEHYGKVDGWTEIVDVCGSAALKADGTVSIFPENAVYHTGSNTSAFWKNAVRDWNDITAIFGNGGTLYGLKKDGSVLAAGSNWNGDTNVSKWADISYIYTSPGIVTVGLKTDGSLVIPQHIDVAAENWTDIRLP